MIRKLLQKTGVAVLTTALLLAVIPVSNVQASQGLNFSQHAEGTDFLAGNKNTTADSVGITLDDPNEPVTSIDLTNGSKRIQEAGNYVVTSNGITISDGSNCTIESNSDGDIFNITLSELTIDDASNWSSALSIENNVGAVTVNIFVAGEIYLAGHNHEGIKISNNASNSSGVININFGTVRTGGKLTLSSNYASTGSTHFNGTGTLNLGLTDGTKIESLKISNENYSDLQDGWTAGMNAKPFELVMTQEIPPITQYNITVETDGNGTASANPETAEKGQEVVLTAVPHTGYQFKQWQIIDGSITIADNKFIMPESDVTVKAIFETEPKPVDPAPTKPVVTAGAGASHQIGDGKDMTFTCSGALDDLTGVYVDDKQVDPSDYTLKSDSTVLTLKASFLDTLSAGEHTLKFQYKDDLSASAKFTIIAKAADTPSSDNSQPDTPNISSPNTGDMANTMLWFSLFLLFGGAFGGISYRRKRKYSK